MISTYMVEYTTTALSRECDASMPWRFGHHHHGEVYWWTTETVELQKDCNRLCRIYQRVCRAHYEDSDRAADAYKQQGNCFKMQLKAGKDVVRPYMEMWIITLGKCCSDS